MLCKKKKNSTILNVVRAIGRRILQNALYDIERYIEKGSLESTLLTYSLKAITCQLNIISVKCMLSILFSY